MAWALLTEAVLKPKPKKKKKEKAKAKHKQNSLILYWYNYIIWVILTNITRISKLLFTIFTQINVIPSLADKLKFHHPCDPRGCMPGTGS
jgi:hypothetical protein